MQLLVTLDRVNFLVEFSGERYLGYYSISTADGGTFAPAQVF